MYVKIWDLKYLQNNYEWSRLFADLWSSTSYANSSRINCIFRDRYEAEIDLSDLKRLEELINEYISNDNLEIPADLGARIALRISITIHKYRIFNPEDLNTKVRHLINAGRVNAVQSDTYSNPNGHTPSGNGYNNDT